MPNHCYYLAISFTNHLYLYSYIYSLAMHLRYSSAPLVIYLLASERSERDTYRGNTIENRGCLFIYWRASVASETLTGVKMKKSGMFVYLLASERSERDTYRGKNEKIGDVCLFVYMYGRTYVILYFDPRVFVLVMWSTPSQIALNTILWFIDQYPYHPRN